MSLDTTALLPWDGTGTGLPWGAGTYMAKREQRKLTPWVTGCSVQVLIGGEAVMNAIRDQLEGMITSALASSQPPGARGYVYITDWRMNGQRDLSEANSWGTDKWGTTSSAVADQTVLGLLMRLIHAGVRVRVLLWMPVGLESLGSGDAHIHDHMWIAAVVGAANRSALAGFGQGTVAGGNLGVVALDSRVTQGNGSHHQKTVVIRGGQGMVGADGNPIAVAFVDGVDLAFTRRDAIGPRTTTPGVQFQDGDWQSGSTIPAAAWPLWPQGPTTVVDYTVLKKVPRLDLQQDTDLYTNVYGDSSTPQLRQVWHDQNLVLRGPIVGLLEGQFIDRWMDSGNFQSLPEPPTVWSLNEAPAAAFGGVLLSTASEKQDAQTLLPLPPPVDDLPITGATSTVQMWRTIPARKRTTPSAYPDKPKVYPNGEFTVMAGYVRAAKAAQHLIWIFDQYFWSQAYSRLLNQLVNDPKRPDLNVIVILPAHADATPAISGSANAQHRARREALNALVGSPSTSRVSVWNLWDSRPWRQAAGLGIYVHAKAHTYDASLLVCGSANINRRSLMGDSEIAAAVLDPAVVASHLRDRWSLLFPGQPWPVDANNQPIDLDQPVNGGAGPGTAFHAAFRAAAGHSSSFLIPDTWSKVNDRLPNGVLREGDIADHKYKLLLNNCLECSSLPENVEAVVSDGSGGTRPPTLEDILNKVDPFAKAAGGG